MRLSLLLTATLLLSACTSMNRTAGAPDGAMPSMMAMSDGDVLKVFMTSNDGEIVTSQAVVDRTQNADVRAFAQMMITEHTAVNARAMALPMQPRDNMVAMSMRQNATAKAAQLAGMSGAMQDKMYIETQVVLHGNTLDMLNNVLIPNARNAQLRALLTETRPAVEMHLRRAEAMFMAMP